MPHSQMPTLLIVDDMPAEIKVVSSFLADRYNMLIATDGKTALQIAESKQPDLILLDVMMPGMDGFDVCKHLKSNPKTNDIPVIFLTAKNQSFDHAKGLFLGAVDFVPKPVNASLLQARLQVHLHIHQLHTELKEKQRSCRSRLKEAANLTESAIEALGSHETLLALRKLLNNG
uniref:Putative response regulator receiver:Metal-dependent phosphohydrolase n=1 Tax=Magnetococcus massalia (strain MO-1) TaxID=451514 RepID=A0A1S7LGR2_MAGMO|nr:Putative response regulator receiver:Metal-dependent phosphohydrolase [Candidatus Magnetococcus massalia]